ncbi:hypothetical protein GUITHDRAFT_105517 [Guillardia theta CCMP2712]|uniref:Uncharacterized protein n=1 Tax=Guillardia theta (strain CCMP2712) TaxID=905079 RepID=L1JKQ3_GUITC|nr:hypothetical protein GUITHDRAFT_105517 [Guillardia theta CCMP2712]EKX48892.1 hypothetical protein GUITHDRAFT_105517 [Guillardia theta CCMP2712]|eukprot:XP_005835872.1 hypothetical protein GUITHDRAFT_105517 [Guillardia theta CCMP2712]
MGFLQSSLRDDHNMMLANIAFVPGQQLFYYGARTWPDGVRNMMYKEYGGMPKDLKPEHDYDPKVLDMPDSAQYWMPGSLDSPYYGSTGF